MKKELLILAICAVAFVGGLIYTSFNYTPKESVAPGVGTETLHSQNV